MAITSDELNFLVYRYMQESGFSHSAFAFGFESMVTKSNINGADVPPGALVSIVQKGLQYLEVEAHLNDDGTETKCDEPFSLLVPHQCSTKDANQDAEIADPLEDDELQLPDSSVQMITGHTLEVMASQWNPRSTQLASGSSDSTARLWSPTADGGIGCITLEHTPTVPGTKNNVTVLDWNNEGSLLGTGSFDGNVRIWNENGILLSTLKRHKQPIFALKWNRVTGLLLTGSVDKTAIVWDAKTSEMKQIFEHHTAPILDVDWGLHNSFASCSTDRLVQVCRLGEANPIKTFKDHLDEVNVVRWNPTGSLLASCSDDCTAKIWSMQQNSAVQNLTEHTKGVYSLRWSPTGPGTANPSRNLLLATAGFDTLVKLWDPERGECDTLRKHTEPVYSIAFSPSGEYIASGSFDCRILIWSVKDCSVVRSYRCPQPVFEVCWNPTGDKVSACNGQNISILDLRT